MSKTIKQVIRRSKLVGAATLFTWALVSPAVIASTDMASLDDDFGELSLDALLDIEVTSVSKKAEKLSEAAAAAFVISGEEIRRSGARNFAEALRLVPGMHVARIDNSSYAVAARGFNGTTSDKMEVLLDGRSLYTPLFSGVFWDSQDYIMEDIDRIEVIRGPAGTLWGSNAVNAVINIVTKSASQSEQDTSVRIGTGNKQKAYASARAAGEIGENLHLRSYVKAWDRENSATDNGGEANDAYQFKQVGFRSDWVPNAKDTLTFQGDIYKGDSQGNGFSSTAEVDERLNGGNAILRFGRQHADNANSTFQLFFDRTYREIPETFLEKRSTWDLSYQLGFPIGESHEIVTGFGYRVSRDQTGLPPQYLIFFAPDSRKLETTNLFIQDQIRLADDLTWTVGTKIEHNDFSDYEIQPSTRLGWVIADGTTLWGAVSRAVGTPNRLEEDLGFFTPTGFPAGCATAPPCFIPPGTIRIGNPDLESEEVIAYELGFRTQTSTTSTIDVALYYNDYKNLLTVEPPFAFDNKMEGTSYGVEVTSIWQPTTDLRVTSGLTWMNLDLQKDADSGDSDAEDTQDDNPNWMFFSRAAWNVRDDFVVDAALRFVDDLKNQQVDDYTELNLRLAWMPKPNMEVVLIGENLLSPDHLEFSGGSPTSTVVEREGRLEFGLRF